jgi:hypothetical protein
MVVLFFAGQPVAKVAIIGGALLLFNRRLKADKVYREIDWPLLVMIVGTLGAARGLRLNTVHQLLAHPVNHGCAGARLRAYRSATAHCRGPGWYRCGYTRRRGFGWGGGHGWHGWTGGGPKGGAGAGGIGGPGGDQGGGGR